jgi:DMSO reductase family type II enzyme iron-sulfur subunit
MNQTGSARQIAMVMDLNKCLGCQTCTVACKKLWNRDTGSDYVYWNNVETLPGQGYPRRWQETGGRDADGSVKRGEMPKLESDYGRAWKFNHQAVVSSNSKEGKTWLRPDGDPKWGPNWDEDRGAGTYPQDNHSFYLPRICNHCTRPACVEACPSGAMYKRADDGIVLRDEERCEGSRDCMRACPYKKIYFNHVRGVAQHCNLCFPRLEQGVAPACARNCPGRLIFVGMLEDEKGPIHRLVNQWKVALPLHPEFGTEPNVFYVPPLSPYRLREDGSIDTETMRIPPEYLESLFGPAVHQALATLRREIGQARDGGHSELLDTLIVYRWKSLFGPFAEEPATVTAAGEGAR